MAQNHDNILYFFKNFAIFHALLNNAYIVWQLCYRFHYQLLITVISYKNSDIYHVGQPKRLSNTLHLDPPPFQFKAHSLFHAKVFRDKNFCVKIYLFYLRSVKTKIGMNSKSKPKLA